MAILGIIVMPASGPNQTKPSNKDTKDNKTTEQLDTDSTKQDTTEQIVPEDDKNIQNQTEDATECQTVAEDVTTDQDTTKTDTNSKDESIDVTGEQNATKSDIFDPTLIDLCEGIKKDIESEGQNMQIEQDVLKGAIEQLAKDPSELYALVRQILGKTRG